MVIKSAAAHVRCFAVNFVKFLKEHLLHRTPLVAASGISALNKLLLFQKFP